MTQIKTDSEKAATRLAYEQAARHNAMEGLPAACDYSNELRDRVIEGELTHGEAAALLAQHYREEEGDLKPAPR